MVRRGVYTDDEIAGLESFWALKLDERKQTIGSRGGNTILEDAGRTPNGKTNLTIGGRLKKAFYRK